MSPYCGSLRADERQEEIHLVLDNYGRWMNVIRGVVAGCHLPGVYQDNRQPLEHGPENTVQLPGEPVTAIDVLIACVGRLDDNQGARSPLQQRHHRPADDGQTVHVKGQRVRGEVRPNVKCDDHVLPPSQVVNLISNVVQVSHGGLVGAQRQPMCAPGDESA